MQSIRLMPAVLVLCTAPIMSVAAPTNPDDAGNRYNLPGTYESEISASASYLATNNSPTEGSEIEQTVIIDVRTIEEYAGGHPPGAISVPFPWVHNRSNKAIDGVEYFYERIAQDPKDFVAAVKALKLHPTKTQIITMCRTGFRSVNAGNLLAQAGFKHVKNMWEGFVGNTKTNQALEEVDLDGDGVVSTSPYSGDRDGWANFAGLPISYDLNPDQLGDPNYGELYYLVAGER